MIVDSSALVAVLLRESRHEEVIVQLLSDAFVGVGAPTLVETSMVMTARAGPVGKSLLSGLIHEADMTIIDFTARHWSVAAHAFGRFGQGRHPAGLNFGDCLTYAVAHIAKQPLLCVGGDFPRTDLDVVSLGG